MRSAIGGYRYNTVQSAAARDADRRYDAIRSDIALVSVLNHGAKVQKKTANATIIAAVLMKSLTILKILGSDEC